MRRPPGTGRRWPLEERNYHPYLALARSLIALGRPEEARTVDEQEIARGIDGWWIRVQLAVTAFLLDDTMSFRRQRVREGNLGRSRGGARVTGRRRAPR
jgi:hypothetical protein